MGYTHYWYRAEKVDKEKFAKAAADCKKVAMASNIPIQYESNNADCPVFDNDFIRFNGVNDDGHETFIIEQDYQPNYRQTDDQGRLFDFCKTARKPYDIVVTACLAIMKYYLGDEFIVKSDGELEEWQAGLNLVEETLGYQPKLFRE